MINVGLLQYSPYRGCVSSSSPQSGSSSSSSSHETRNDRSCGDGDGRPCCCSCYGPDPATVQLTYKLNWEKKNSQQVRLNFLGLQPFTSSWECAVNGPTKIHLFNVLSCLFQSNIVHVFEGSHSPVGPRSCSWNGLSCLGSCSCFCPWTYRWYDVNTFNRENMQKIIQGGHGCR